MNDLNSIYLVGRLTADAVVRQSDKNMQICFTISNNQYNYDESKKEYVYKPVCFDIVAIINKDLDIVTSGC